MKRYQQYQPVVVSDFEADVWPHPEHNHNHYELIFIKDGKGSHVIQQVPNAYHPGDIFLLGPDDQHYFEIEEHSRFIYVKFTDSYLYRDASGMQPNMQKLEYLIKSRETHQSGFLLTPEDQQTVRLIFEVIVALNNNPLHNEQLLWTQVLTVAAILQRNMPKLKATGKRSRDMQAVFCYLHKYIYSPDKLRANVMAANFNTTPDYIGPYFKRNTGITLRDYIRDYRRTLINLRMAGGQYSLKEIAAELGLTDESHVIKIINRPD